MRVKGSSSAVRVAAVATAAIAVVYVIGAVSCSTWCVARHLTQIKDRRPVSATASRSRGTIRDTPRAAGGPRRIEHRPSTRTADPVFLWAVSTRRVVVAHSPGAPAAARLTCSPRASCATGRAITATWAARARSG